MVEKLSPSIRFDTFSDNWEQRKLEDIADIVGGGTPSTSNPEYWDGDIDWYAPAEMEGQRYAVGSVKKITELGFQKSSAQMLPAGRTVLFTSRAGIGKMALLQHPAATNQGFQSIVLKDGNNPYFIYSMGSEIKKKAESIASGSTFLEISGKMLGSLVISIPSKAEQDEIATYFQKLDDLITLHQQKCDRLVAVRASMLEKLFVRGTDSVPQIRFGEYTKPWRKARLGEIVVPYSDPVETPHDGYERLGIRSHGKGVFHDYVEAGKELGTAQMHRVVAHNLIVNITFAWEHAVAITGEDDEGKLVSHRFPQFSMTDDVYDQFLKYLILDSKFRHHLQLSSPGGAGRNRVMKVPEMLEYEVMIPEIEEQKAIAGYLNALDELIELYKVRVEKLKNIKTAFLQKMFV